MSADEFRNLEDVLRDRWTLEERIELGRLAVVAPGEALVVAEFVALLDARPVA